MASCRAACLVLLPTLLWAVAAAAQTRSVPIPEGSARGYIRHVMQTAVTVDGKPMQLAAGATVRDQRNLIVVPASIPREGAWANYILDRSGQIFRVWLLTPEEIARPGGGG